MYPQRKVYSLGSVNSATRSDDSDLSSEDDMEFTTNDNIPCEESSTTENEDSAASETDEIILSDNNTNKTTVNKGKRKPDLVWKTIEPNTVEVKDLPFTGDLRAECDVGLQEPIYYFRKLISNDILNHILEETNKYSVQINPDKPLKLSKDELEQFIGILFIMSIVRMPSVRNLWEHQTRYEKVANVMSRTRFEQIKRFLHCNDNNEIANDCQDVLYKIRPLVDHLKNKFQQFTPTEYLCIDEQMVPFKGRSRLKQYNPNKPKKWGYKLYVLCSVDGLVYNVEVHTGKINPCPNQPDIQASGNIVLHLLQHIERGKWYKLFIDNWYISIPLASLLMSQGIAVLGTVRSNRLRICKMIPDAELRKKGRGSMEIKLASEDNIELRVIKSFDDRPVTMLTTFEAVEPIKQVRWDKKDRKEIFVECPSAVMIYNKNMGGVDLLDGFLSYYRIPVRSKKWYHRLIWHFFDLCIVQSWILYKKDVTEKDSLGLKLFKLAVADALLLEGKSIVITPKRGRPSRSIDAAYEAKKKKGPTAPIPSNVVRTDGYNHLLKFPEKKGRCRKPGCKGIPRVICSKCNVHLFHTIIKLLL